MKKINRAEAADIYTALLQAQMPDAVLRDPQNLGGSLAKTAMTLAEIFDKAVTGGAPTYPKATASFGEFRPYGDQVIFVFERKGQEPEYLPICSCSVEAADSIAHTFNSFLNDQPEFSPGSKIFEEI